MEQAGTLRSTLACISLLLVASDSEIHDGTFTDGDLVISNIYTKFYINGLFKGNIMK